MGPAHRPEHLLVDVIARGARVDRILGRALLEPRLLRGPARAAAPACTVCKSRLRRLWHGVCAWCGADLEELEQG
jgi:hypothetical protein